MIDMSLQVELSIRLIIAAGLGAAVGAEREIHGHPAGMRTHMLVALGSALFTVLSIHGFGQDDPAKNIDPTRIAAQIVSGIGFLGAGAILKDGVVIRGLTTAASLWAVAAVGTASGAGEYFVAGVATVVILVSLWPLNALAERLHGSAEPEVQVRLHMNSAERIGQVSTALVANHMRIGTIQTQRLGKDFYRADIGIRGRNASQVNAALDAIERIEGVEIVTTTTTD
jgi:putative Mg2+ transporter-C (MgtC) family protein